MTTERAELAAEIKEFIEKHANISPSYDPEHDDPEDRFTGPDASLMNHAALALEEDREFSFVHSDWGSGCYSPYGDKQARAWHDDLKQRANDLRLSPKSSLR